MEHLSMWNWPATLHHGPVRAVLSLDYPESKAGSESR
jgi:hypothetical protein